MLPELTEVVRETMKSAARKLTGFRRRQFQAEVAQQYCRGSARQAERIFGWGRSAVQTGLSESRTGIRCLDNFSDRGRHKTEEQHPELVEQIHAIVAPESQADPKFQTPLVVSVSLVYAATRHEEIGPILDHAWRFAVWIFVFMAAIVAVLQFMTWQLG